MGDRTTARGKGRNGDLENTKIVLGHWVGCTAPSILLDALARGSECSEIQHTEFSDQVRLLSVGCPFPVVHLVVWPNVESEILVALGEFIVSTLMEFDEVLPSLIRVVPLDDGGDMWLEVRVDVKNNLRVKGCGGHGSLTQGKGKRGGWWWSG